MSEAQSVRKLGALDTLEVDVTNHVATVTLNRPEQHNAFDAAMRHELTRLWSAVRDDPEVRCVILTGAGRAAFCTGIDRAEVPTDEQTYDFDALTYQDPGIEVGPKSNLVWKPVVAAVNGMACGGAFYLLGECDFIIAAETATFFDPHLTYGMPAVLEPMLMQARMPYGEISRLTLLGSHERMTAARACAIGLVSEVTAPDDLLDQARWAAEVIAGQPPRPVQATVRALWAARELSPAQAQSLGALLLNAGLDLDLLAQGSAHFAGGRRAEPRHR